MEKPKLFGDSTGGFFSLGSDGTVKQVTEGVGRPPAAKIAEYNAYVKNEQDRGVPPNQIKSFQEYHAGMRASGAPQFNVSNQMGERAGDAISKMNDKLQDKAAVAQATGAELRIMDQILQDPNFQTGSFQSASAGTRRMIQSALGLKPDQVPQEEVFASLSTKLVMPTLKATGTNPTDKDLEFASSNLSSTVTRDIFYSVACSNGEQASGGEEAEPISSIRENAVNNMSSQ